MHSEPPVSFFPAASIHESHTPETVLEQVVVPAGNRLLGLADFARAFQHGRVQSYLTYLCAGLIVLSVAVILLTE